MIDLRPIELERMKRNKKVMDLFLTGKYTLKELGEKLDMPIRTLSTIISKELKVRRNEKAI